jgi:cathepsin L
MFDSEDKGEVGDINWVTNGAVTEVKNQGNCNSAYAFSAIGAIEGLGKIGKQKTLYSLSEQQVIDCSEKYGNYGCQRGYMDATYNYARDNAIYESKHYPYQGAKQSCQK